jgi:hypothetical protein
MHHSGSVLPVGEPFLVYDFRNPRLSMLAVNLSDLDLCVAQDKFVMLLAEANWNIWMTELNAPVALNTPSALLRESWHGMGWHFSERVVPGKQTMAVKGFPG